MLIFLPPAPASPLFRLVRIAIVLTLGWLLSAPTTLRAEDKVFEQVKQLAEINARLATTCSPSEGLAELESVCAGILVVLYGLEQGQLTIPQIQDVLGAGGLAYLSPYWLPFAVHYTDVSAYRKPLDMLGLGSRTWGTDSKLDVYRFLALLRLLHTDSTGRPQFDSRIHMRYLSVANRGRRILQRLEASHRGDLSTQQEACSRWVLERANPEWHATLHRQVRRDATTFIVLRDEDVPRPNIANVLAVAYRDMALGAPNRYPSKWFWHGILLDEMFQRARTGTRTEITNAVRLYVPSYVLLCHAGTPISVFRPCTTLEHGTTAFTEGYEEDIPHQQLFSNASHLSPATALRYELKQSGIHDFNPIQHMVCFPYHAVANKEDTRLMRTVRIAGGYLGYLDAFESDAVPHRFQLGFLDEGNP